MSLPWFKAAVSRVLRHREDRITEGRAATEMEAEMEAIALAHDDRLPPLSTFARTLMWDRGRVRRRGPIWFAAVDLDGLPEWTTHTKRTSDEQMAHTKRTPPKSAQSSESEGDAHETHTRRTSDAPTRARLYKREREEEKRDTVWSAYKDIHPRARKRPPGMGARVKEHGAEAVALMLRWVRDADGRAAFLREGGHTGKTLFRPSNCGEYIEMSEAWAANGSPVARTAANDPATAAWAEMMALPSWASADRRNVPRCERYPNAWMLAKDETEHGRRLSAVSRAGGWQTWCNDRANRWKVDEFSARFRAAYGEG